MCKLFCRALCLILFSLLHLPAAGTELSDMPDTGSLYTEDDCLGIVTDATFDNSILNAKLLGQAMTRGYWKCANIIAKLANEASIDVRSVFDLETRTINKEIALLKTTIDSTLPISTINPAFQWAQSPQDIFINVKFAHKLDAPATLNVEAQNVSLAASTLFLRATDGRKLFSLDLEFLKEIVPNESTWSMASVGRMTLTLKKKGGPARWSRLTKSRKKPNNIHFWWELHDKYSSELDNLGEDEDEDDDSDKTADKSSNSEEKMPDDDNKSAANDVSSPTDDTKKTKKVKKRRDRTPEEQEYDKEKSRLSKEMKELFRAADEKGKEQKKAAEEKLAEEKIKIDQVIAEEKKAIRQEYLQKIKEAEVLLGLHTPEVKVGTELEGKEEL